MDNPRPLHLDYSLKNIPITSEDTYTTRLIEKVESVLKQMRWNAFFCLKGPTTDDPKVTYDLKSRKCSPQVDELKAFKDDALTIIEMIEFRRVTDPFQQQLRSDIQKIRASPDIIVPADKTRNLYEVNKEQYTKLLSNNITKHYKPTPAHTYDQINSEAQTIAATLELDDIMDAYITLKDHKDNFSRSLPCRLINPSKREIGIVSKSILDTTLKQFRPQLQINAWFNTAAVIEWFSIIPEKENCICVYFDIVDFYPSISEDLLQRSVEFARRYTDISQEECDIIFHSRRSLLFGLERHWVKRHNEHFDVTMGCYDGAEVCKLEGAFALAMIADVFDGRDVGLYRDDGLAVFRNASGHEADQIRKEMTKIFKNLGLKSSP